MLDITKDIQSLTTFRRRPLAAPGSGSTAASPWSICPTATSWTSNTGSGEPTDVRASDRGPRHQRGPLSLGRTAAFNLTDSCG